MPLLRSLSLKRRGSMPEDGFPFGVPAVRTLESIDFEAPVTFFVGENGSGKSTLLEALAIAAGLPAVGSEATAEDPSLRAQRALAKHLALTWSRRTHRGFFLRAEDFFGFAKRVSQLRAEMSDRLREIETEYADREAYAQGLAALPMRSSIAELERRYGVDLDENSHGQSFLLLFRSRLVPEGLYLLDEPEAPLSPQSQLALISMIADQVGRKSQFVIATHSPILLAFPGAAIYTFDRTPVTRVTYDELEHVALTRAFLNDPTRFLRHLA